MSKYESWSLLIQCLVLFAGVLTVVVYYRQLQAMQQQISAVQDSSRTQNLLALIDYIQRPEHREARRILHTLDKKPLAQWTDEERKQAEMAGSAWDAVGLMLRNTVIPQAEELILSHWRHSIYSCHAITAELLGVLRESREPAFWADFDWLAAEARKEHFVVDGKMRPKAWHRAYS